MVERHGLDSLVDGWRHDRVARFRMMAYSAGGANKSPQQWHATRVD
jgi:hypothetical protein